MKIKITDKSTKKQLLDYQWPSAFIKNKKLSSHQPAIYQKKEIKNIENFFFRKFGYKTKLFPSARAAIAIILKFLKFDRSKEVFTDKWSSHCLFNTVGAHTNISTSFASPDLVICIHKWGEIKKIKVKKKFYIIEDSVDSLILNKKSLFPNNGEFEIISLPKVIGSVAGGLVLSKNKKFLDFCTNEQKKNMRLGIYQSKEKFRNNSTNNYNTWLHFESWNTYTDSNSINNIKKCLKNYELNKDIIAQRLSTIEKILKIKNDFKNRLGPVLPIQITKIKNLKRLSKNFIVRHNSKNISKKEKFKKYLLLPLHFGINNKKFKDYLSLLKNNLRN